MEMKLVFEKDELHNLFSEKMRMYYSFSSLVDSKNKNVKLSLTKEVLPESIEQ